MRPPSAVPPTEGRAHAVDSTRNAPDPDEVWATPPAGRRRRASRRLRTSARFDVPASLVVFLVAVPLSLGIAVASNAPVAAALVAAVVGGVVAGLVGGAPLQVSGTAAGLTVVVAETVAEFGWPATCAITAAAGLLQILLGVTWMGRFALAISPTRPSLKEHTLVVLTADHGGDGADHSNRKKLQNYRIPFMVWGPGVPADRSLYALSPARQDPGTSRPTYAGKQPIRNGDAANLAADALDLAAVPGSELNRDHSLNVVGR